MNLPTSPERAARLAGAAAAVGFVGVAIFEIALAAGVPWGHAAWGGAHAHLSTAQRLGSGAAVVVWAGAAVIVLGRAGYWGRDGSSTIFRRGTWLLAAVSTLGALANFASQSRWENFVFGPLALTMAILCIIVARSAVTRETSPRKILDRLAAGS